MQVLVSPETIGLVVHPLWKFHCYGFETECVSETDSIFLSVLKTMVIASMSTALLVLTTKTFYTPLPIDVIIGQLLLFIQSCVFLTSKLAFSILYLNGCPALCLFS